jgi:hypothetical protein
MTERRFDRNERLFGAAGQEKVGATAIVIVGCGGLGSIVGQQAAYLGIRRFALVDADLVTASSMNRLVGAVPADVDTTPKVEVVERTIMSVAPDATVTAVRDWLTSAAARSAIGQADVIVGCLDDDVARLELTGLAVELGKPVLDLASDVNEEGTEYGGRVVFAEPGLRCVYCLGEFDPEELALANLTPEQRRARDKVYGVRRAALDHRGASVVSLNGVVASLALTELMVYITGLRLPAIKLTYLGHHGTVRKTTQEPAGPCPYCGRN